MRRMTQSVIIVLALLLLAHSAFAAGQEEATAAPAGFRESGFPIVEDTVTLTAFASRRSRDIPLRDLPLFAALEERTNVRIDWTELEVGYGERKSLILASGDLPDIFWGAGLNDSDVLGNLESFVPLRGLIDSYAPHVTRFMELEPLARGIAVAPDGEMYSMPARMPHRPNPYHTFAINKSWLDNLGLDVPTTTEEFFDVMLAFKNEDANLNGDPNDEIPWAESTWGGTRFEWLRASFGLRGSRVGLRELQVVDGGRAHFTPSTDEYKAFVSYLSRLWEAGLIDPESFTQNETQWRTKMRNDGFDYFVVGGASVFTIESMFGSRGDDEYIAIPPLVGPFGHQEFIDNGLEPVNRHRAAITILNEHPEVTMRWLDTHYEDDVSVQMQYGFLGERLTKNEQGMYEFLPLDDPNMSYDVAKWMFAPANPAPMGVYPALEARIVPDPTTAIKMAESAEMVQYVKPEFSYPRVFLDQDISREVAIIWADLESIILENYAKWIVEGGIESEWDGYIRQLEAANLARYMEIYQTALDAYLAN